MSETVATSASPAGLPRRRTLLFSRWKYYLTSIPTLLLRIRNWPTVLAMFLGLPVRRPVTIELRSGGRFRVRTRMDIWNVKETCLDRDYERDAVPLQDGWTIIDIGGGLGDFTIHAARLGGRSTVYAFEPLLESFLLLQENLALNGVTNVQAFQEAIAGKTGDRFLFTRTGVTGQHRTADSVAATTGDSVRVPAATLDEAFRRFGIERCDFLKIDCEGAEYEILFSASEGNLGRVRHIAMEFHEGVTSYSHRDLVQFLEQRDFRVSIRRSPAHDDLGFLFATNGRLAMR